ncbi:type II toxin-antitoxin system PemK/MazF family toxin [Luteimonas endophytica]|uniref:type II toxin-antitoxin system PemK/MazF family toxin n=1 Tax=Luteimonas endophytica TaxID=3042023 RepID=UPI003CE4C844
MPPCSQPCRSWCASSSGGWQPWCGPPPVRGLRPSRSGRDATAGHRALINYGDIFRVAADASIGAMSGSPHPHLVMQSDVFNHSRIATVVVCSLSEHIEQATWCFRAVAGPAGNRTGAGCPDWSAGQALRCRRMTGSLTARALPRSDCGGSLRPPKKTGWYG